MKISTILALDAYLKISAREMLYFYYLMHGHDREGLLSLTAAQEKLQWNLEELQ